MGTGTKDHMPATMILGGRELIDATGHADLGIAGARHADPAATFSSSIPFELPFQPIRSDPDDRCAGSCCTISYPTVNTHINHIYKKLHVDSVAAAVKVAMQEGLV